MSYHCGACGGNCGSWGCFLPLSLVWFGCAVDRLSSWGCNPPKQIKIYHHKITRCFSAVSDLNGGKTVVGPCKEVYKCQHFSLVLEDLLNFEHGREVYLDLNRPNYGAILFIQPSFAGIVVCLIDLKQTLIYSTLFYFVCEENFLSCFYRLKLLIQKT
jgi:hypothetical protein